MWIKSTCLFLAFSLATVLLTPLKAEVESVPPHYSLEEVHVVLETSASGIKGINNAGDVVGTLYTPEHHCAAFMYHKGKARLLGTLGGKESWATATNDKGQIVGITQRADGITVPFIWEQGQMREIAPVPTVFGRPGSVSTDAVAGLNNKGQVVGCLGGYEGACVAVQWQLGQEATPQNTGNSKLGFIPINLNDAGQIVGVTYYGFGGPIGSAVLWDGHKQQNLGALIPHGISRPAAINNRGQVVGTASTEGIYKGHAFLWQDNTLHDLGTAGGQTSAANAINNKGQVVGEAYILYEEHKGNNTKTWGGHRAMLWQDGKAYDLNDLIGKEVGWILESAVSINDRGQIVGTGYHSNDQGRSSIGNLRAFMLTSVPRDPHSH